MSSRPVYSTESGRLCPDCGRPVNACECRSRARQTAVAGASEDVVRIRRETRGRRGKTVTVLDGLGPDMLLLARIASELKKHCGTGGSVNGVTVEIQGDKRELVKRWLEGQGFTARLAGG